MKKILWVMVIVTLAAAGRKDLSMLNQQILSLEEQNRTLQEENKALNQSNLVFEAEVTKKDTELQQAKNTIAELNKKIEVLQKQLKSALSGSTSPNSPAGFSPFPITGNIVTKKAHDASNLAVLLSFKNPNAESITGFNAKLTFSQHGQPLLTCSVRINKSLPAGGEVTWYGAIPYNSMDNNNVRLYNAQTNTISVAVEVTSVTLTNGAVRNYK